MEAQRHRVTPFYPPLEGEGRPRSGPGGVIGQEFHPLPTPSASTSPLQGEVKEKR